MFGSFASESAIRMVGAGPNQGTHMANDESLVVAEIRRRVRPLDIS